MNQTSESGIRINKYIADSGLTSRRKAEELVLAGKVKLNEKRVTSLSTKVGEEDVVSVEGNVINPEAVIKKYYVFNKPRGCITSVYDPEGRKTVMDFFPTNKRLYPVGRLDYLSEGLLIMTNDGDTGNQIAHPSFEVVKTYEVKVFGRMNQSLLSRLRKGVSSEVGFLKPESVRVVKELPNKTWLEIRLQEGKNREIRRLCEAHQIVIDKLKRVAIGGLSITGVAPGKWYEISKSELMKRIATSKQKRTFHSNKKSVNLKGRKGAQHRKFANDPSYQGFTKEQYYQTIEAQKLMKKEQEMERASKN